MNPAAQQKIVSVEWFSFSKIHLHLTLFMVFFELDK